MILVHLVPVFRCMNQFGSPKQSVKLASNVVLVPFCGKGCGSAFKEREREAV